MAIKVRPGNWACGVCKKVYPDPIQADLCRDSHGVIYVPFTKEELNRLINFIYTKEEALLTPALVDKLSKYLRSSSEGRN